MIFWDLRRSDEHPGLEAGEPPPGLLSRPEAIYFSRLATPMRRREWLLGRYCAKALCLAWLRAQGSPAQTAELTIAPASDGAPQALLAGEGHLPVTLSLSHRAGLAVCALADAVDAPLGADVELCERRPPGFEEDHFTDLERELLGALPIVERVRASTEVWSLKEAALKATREGLMASTWSVSARPRGARTPGWGAASVVRGDGARFEACVRDDGPFVVTLVRGGELPLAPSDALRGAMPLARECCSARRSRRARSLFFAAETTETEENCLARQRPPYDGWLHPSAVALPQTRPPRPPRSPR